MQLKHEITVEQPAEAAWRVLGERFGDLTWSSTVAKSELEGELGVGATRSCRSSTSFGPFPPSLITERLTHFDREQMELRYEAEKGLPGFIAHASNRWTIEALGETRCKIVTRAELKLVWWAAPLSLLFPMLIKSDMKKFIDELRATIDAEQICPLRQSIAL